MTVKLYVEGGGDAQPLRAECREGFRAFLERAGFRGRLPRVVACGGRQAAYDHFRTACEAGDRAVLLIDSESPALPEASPWAHLASRRGDEMPRPEGARDDQLHFMVVVMESWFLADPQALGDFFGPGFKRSALPGNPNVEAVPKKDVLDALKRASTGCKVKAGYGKGPHSFKILARVSPDLVRAASVWAKRFLERLSAIMSDAAGP